MEKRVVDSFCISESKGLLRGLESRVITVQ